MNSNIIKNMADPLSNQDVASKNYLDSNAFITAGGVVSGDIKLNIASDLVASLGCNDLTTGKKFTLLLRTDTNMLSYSVPDSHFPMPIKIKTDGGFLILISQQPICDFGWNVILCSQPIDKYLHLIKNVSPVNKLDAVNKACIGRIKCKTATGIIPNTVMTDHTLFTFAAAKAFASGKIICEMRVERLADEWIATSSPMFATAWPGFHKFSRGPPLMTFFNGSRQWLDSQFSPRLCRTTMNQFI